jgi:signal transduction histidine kinase
MNPLYGLVRHPGIYATMSSLLVLLAMFVAGSLANRDLESARETALVTTLGTYAAALEGGTTNSRAMGAAMLFGLEDQDVKQLAAGKLPPDAPEVMHTLETLRTLYSADSAFVVDRQGVIAAFSGKGDKHDTGRDLSSYPYVQLAMRGTPNVYPAVDSDGIDRGIYLAAPLRAAMNNTSRAIGVVAVKVGADKLDALLKSWTDGTAVLLSPQGVVFAASREDWLFRVAGEMSASRLANMRTRQFGKAFDQTPKPPLSFTPSAPETMIDDVRYVVRSFPLEWNDPEGDWTLTFLERRAHWWTQGGVLGFAGLAGLIAALALFWLYTLARDAEMLKSLNAELSAEVAERKRMESRLARSLSLQQATLESTNDAILVVDRNNTWVLYNQRFIDLWKIPDEIIAAGDDRIALSYVLDQLEDADGFLNKVVDLYGKPEVSSFDIIKFKDGRIIERNSMPQLIDGKVVGRVWSFHDVTELKRAEQVLRESMRQVEKKELSKTRFLAAAGHDLRQPLAAANLFLDALKFSEPSPKQEGLINRLDQAMSTFGGLLDSLLNISKLDSGAIKPECAPINVTEIFNALEQSFVSMASAKQIGFKLYFPMKETLVVVTDIGLLNSALSNLVSNAIKYTAEGAILISARKRGSEVLFQVWDTGIGISGEHIELVFDEFYQVSNQQRDRTAGMGLGLAIAKRAITLLGSNITCRSQLGRGSVFEFRLPLDDKSRKLMQQATKVVSRRDITDLSFVQGKRLVVIEDDLLVAQALTQSLEGLGGEVECFHSAEDALRHGNIGYADCYIVDYMLGGTLNGIQFLNRLRQKLGKPINAVLVTGDTSSSFIREAADCDWPVLHKPVNTFRLVSCLGAHQPGSR